MRPTFLLVVCALAGCLANGDEDLAPPGECPPAECPPGPAQVLEASLTSCVMSAFTIELRSEVYALPEGFTSDPSATSPQRVPVGMGKCAGIDVMGQVEHDVSFGHVGILVVAPDRGQKTDFDLFDLELFTDSPALATMLAAGGLPVVGATIELTDSGPIRQVAVRGGAQYDATSEFVPSPGATADVSEAHHSETGWTHIGRTCGFYSGTAPSQMVVERGRLTEAAGGGPLLGRGSQMVSCDLTIRVSLA